MRVPESKHVVIGTDLLLGDYSSCANLGFDGAVDEPKIWDRALTGREVQANMQFAFKGYPANVIKAEVLGETKRRKGTGDEIKLEYDLHIGVDVEQYDRVVQQKLLPILEKVAQVFGFCHHFLARARADSGQ